jgi:ribulose-phosphate 3-epimerase
MTTIEKLRGFLPTISVGILTADMMNLQSELNLIEQAGVKLLHFDVMDGRVWPKITAGAFLVSGVKTPLLKDVHLLIDKPEEHIEAFVKAGADIITFSVEYCADVKTTLEAIRRMQKTKELLIGLSLNPLTSIDAIADFIDDIDIVELLAIGPDTGNDNFIWALPERIFQLRKLKKDILVFVDGAIKKDNIAQVVRMGPDVIVTGSAVFDGKDPRGNAEFMLNSLQS